MNNTLTLVNHLEEANQRFILEVESKYPINTQHDKETRETIFKELLQIASSQKEKYLDDVFESSSSQDYVLQKIHVELFIGGKPLMVKKLNEEGLQAVVPFAYEHFEGALQPEELDNLLMEAFMESVIELAIEDEYFEYKDGCVHIS